jgi:amino acid transporter
MNTILKYSFYILFLVWGIFIFLNYLKFKKEIKEPTSSKSEIKKAKMKYLITSSLFLFIILALSIFFSFLGYWLNR